jgi:hypothetical protein
MKPQLLHVARADAVAARLRRSGLPGRVVVWADPLHEGPVPAGQSAEAIRQARARYVAQDGLTDHQDAVAQRRDWDRGVESAREHDEATLWLEPDLGSQLALLRHVDFLTRRGRAPGTLSVIAVDRFPGIEPFRGLDQLSAGQLAALFPRREVVDSPAAEAASAAWAAFTAPDPAGLERAAASPAVSLPFLAPAFARLLQEYPWQQDGLARSERQALEAAAARPVPVEAFAAAQAREERPFLADRDFLRLLRRLALGERPLLRLSGEEGPLIFRKGAARLTRHGEAVLAGSADAIVLRGIDRWIGGVHLTGAESPWRWDEGAGALRATG